jgi:hypothetical protein
MSTLRASILLALAAAFPTHPRPGRPGPTANVSTSPDPDEGVNNRGLQVTVAYNLMR